MSVAKKIAVAVVSVAAAAAVGFAGYKFYKHSDETKNKGKVYVTQVAELNTAGGLSLSGSRFSGVIEAQKTEDFKFDRSKTVKSIDVAVGDVVNEGDVLFSYDVDAMKLELEQGKIEVERMENEVETMALQLEDLEKEKDSAAQDAQASLTAQILSLQSDKAKTEYDIKAKKTENKKLKKSIKNSQVTSTLSGTVKTVANAEELEYAESDVVVSISKGDDLRVKGVVNEQMIQNIYEGMSVTIRSRTDDETTWSGIISEISTEPVNNNNDYYMEDSDPLASSSKYAFYIEPESLDGLMLGQHIIIEPDLGGDNIVKTGIWLYSDFIFKEKGKSYVWADDGKGKIEKREVKVGQKDEANGDCEITSGLDKDDKIAYPDKNISEGMTVTDDQAEATIPEEDYNNGEDMGGMDEGYAEDFEGMDEGYVEDFEGMDEDTAADEAANAADTTTAADEAANAADDPAAQE